MNQSTGRRTARGRLRSIVLAVVGIVAGLGLGVGTAHAEPFRSSAMSRSWTPWTSTWSQGPQYWTIGAGTSVNMRCWNTGATRDGTAKWFWVTSNNYPYTQGYVPANDVSGQWQSSPPC